MENRTKRLRKSWWRCRMLSIGGVYVRSFYRRIGTLSLEINPLFSLILYWKSLPIKYDRNDPMGLMASVIYTFYGLLTSARQWKDNMFLSCNCGFDFDMKLGFEEHWHMWQQRPEMKPFEIECNCPNCGRTVKASFPDCHLLP